MTLWARWQTNSPTIRTPQDNVTVEYTRLNVEWDLVPNATYTIQVRNLRDDRITFPALNLPAGTWQFSIPAGALIVGDWHRVAVSAVTPNAVNGWSQRVFWVAGVQNLNNVDYIINTVRNFFINKGFTRVQTAGIMGNLFQESSWNPLRRSSGSQFWGLFQLNRTLALQLHAEYERAGLDMSRYGYDITTHHAIGGRDTIPRNDLTTILAVQLEFAYNQRPTPREWNQPLRAATSAEEAAEIFLVNYLGAVSGGQAEGDRLLYHPGIIINDELRIFFQNAAARRGFALRYL